MPSRRRRVPTMLCLASVGLAAIISARSHVFAQHGAAGGEWRTYGADAGASKYSPLDQIDRTNVKDLQIAWRWKTDNLGPRPDFNLEATPLMIGGVLYTTAGARRAVAAIDATTGETLWLFRYDEGERAKLAPNRALSGRGVAYWTDGRGDERILYVTGGYRLIALNLKTGRPVTSFGKDGVVDLQDDFDQIRFEDGEVALSAVPTVVKDVIVIGAAMGLSGTATKLQAKNPRQYFPKGYIRGFDIRTGKRIWTFHTIPQPGEFGIDTWERDSWSYTGHAGSWGGIAADEALGYVYVPVDTPTNDYFGGNRPGNGLFGESLVCLDAATGKRIWHFQFVHHGVWDYDTPTLPNLVDITVNGRAVKAVAQVTKQAFVYVFDRATGQPIWPIEERPVPQSDVEGEKTSPTQPFPTKPAAFDRQGVTLDDLIDFTPELKAEATKIASQYRLGPVFTPPMTPGTGGLKGVLSLPGATGGANWQGAAVDPATGILYVTSSTNPAVVGPQGLPIVRPPWGRITAINLNTGDHVWMVANGEAPPYVQNHAALKGVTLPRTGKPGRAGLLLTKTLLFAGEGAGLQGERPGSGGPMFRAYDKATGATIWEFKLPANQSGLPMTYMAGGKQYVVVGVGGPNMPGEFIALKLP